MAWAKRDHARTRMDGHKGAIGDVVLRIVKRGDAVTVEAICAALDREGQARAASIVRDAAKVAEGNAPPVVMVTKPTRKR